MNKFTTILGASVVAATFAGAANAETWDMPMAYADSNYHSQNGKKFAEAVGVCTGGDLTINVHAGGSLFGGADIKRAVQTGQAPIGERFISAHQNENPLYGIDSVPFLATSFADSEKLWDVTKDKLSETLNEDNLVLLYSVPWPPQGLYFKKEVNSVADTQGVKFRSYNSATARVAELMGMAPVQVEAAELSQALSTGVAEAFVSSGSTGYDRKVWEQLTHFYDAQAWLPRNFVFANKSAFDDLPQQSQNCLKSAGMMAQVAGTARAEQLSGWYLEQLAANGMTVAKPSGTLVSDLEKIGATMAAEWAESAGAEGAKLVDAYKAE